MAKPNDKQMVDMLKRILRVQAIQVAAGKGITEAATPNSS